LCFPNAIPTGSARPSPTPVVIYKNIKVNYTRKIQHLFAYLLPMLFHTFLPKLKSEDGIFKPILSAFWGYWFVLLAFLVVIYPVRMRIKFVSIMFSCLDRPEDRPHTLKWIVTQVVLGYIIIQTFEGYCSWSQRTTAQALSYVFVLTTGVGDGLAEPVGIAFGRNKYKTRALCSSRKFTRSLEGSSCVYIVCLICCLAFYSSWDNWFQMMIGAFTIPLAMTLAEAFSPHTFDTPFLMGSGGFLILAITYIGYPNPDLILPLTIIVALLGIGLNTIVLGGIIFVVVRKNQKKKIDMIQKNVNNNDA